MPAYYRSTLRGLLDDDDARIVGQLTRAAEGGGFYQQLHAQTRAWTESLAILRLAAGALIAADAAAGAWAILVESPIPRRGKRVDAVLLAGPVVLVLEFKCGARDFPHDAVAQVEDYALDLADFHRESRGRPIVPILIATAATTVPGPARLPIEASPVRPIERVGAEGLADRVRGCVDRDTNPGDVAIDPAAWDASAYAPTPTIIEAAQALYAGQGVQEIGRCHAGIDNLTRTTEAVLEGIAWAQREGRKQILFVTGVPGAGKTLAGLNIVHNRELHERDLGVFLSGNTPLVRVLTEALSRDAAARLEQSRAESRRRVATFVQNVHHFIDDYHADPDRVPVDRVVVFDEAQRAWDAEQSNRKFQRPFSEPEILLEVMSRHDGWAVIVALVGGGQEINRGEAGLAEWGRTLVQKFPTWSIAVAPELKAGVHASGACLFETPPEGLDLVEDPALHLGVNLRSYRAEVLADFVDALLRLEPERARELMTALADFPLGFTRDLDAARRWLRARRRGHRRIGLIASSGGRRLRAYGVDVTAELDVENWFLNGPDDVRSWHALEVPATEFAIQGLELDWTGVCWGGDLIPGPDGWEYRSFRGTAWQQVRDPVTRRYLVNKYRVLLTRAREGMILYVPPGDPADPTRPPALDDRVARYLAACGIPRLASEIV